MRSDLRALPYPPQTVWCAPVGDGNSPQVVLVAEHADLYTAYWVVHDSVSPSLLKAVGCPEFYKPAPATGEDAHAATPLALAAMQSYAENRPVKL